MKKKLLALLLAMLMLVSSLSILTGCKKDDDDDDSPKKKKGSDEEIVQVDEDKDSDVDEPTDDNDAPAKKPADDDDDVPAKKPNSASAADPEDLIVGDWVCNVRLPGNALSMAIASQAGDPTLGDYFNFSDVKIAFNMSFDRDGECLMELDQRSFTRAINTLLEDIKPGLTRYMEKLARDNGMTLQDALDRSGVSSVDELVDAFSGEMMGELDQMETRQRMDYKFRNGELYIDGDQIDIRFEDNDTLLITGGEGADELIEQLDEFGMGDLLPLRLERV